MYLIAYCDTKHHFRCLTIVLFLDLQERLLSCSQHMHPVDLLNHALQRHGWRRHQHTADKSLLPYCNQKLLPCDLLKNSLYNSDCRRQRHAEDESLLPWYNQQLLLDSLLTHPLHYHDCCSIGILRINLYCLIVISNCSLIIF